MPAVQPVFGHPGLRISFTCAAAVTGGQIVERAVGTRLVQPAAAGSVHAAGVALFDVPLARATIQGPQVGDGNELTVISGIVISVVYSAAAVEGDPLVITAGGQVAPAALTPDARTLVGRAFEAAAAGATALAYIRHGG